MKAVFVSLLVGSLALTLASNITSKSSSNDSLTSSSNQQPSEYRRVVGFKPSGPPPLATILTKNPVPQESSADFSEEVEEEGPELEQVPGKDTLRRIKYSVVKESSGNNTIDSAGTGHYDHAFAPVFPLEHHHQEHVYQLHKPLKPSVVHRDPNALFDQYDAIRTQDYDRQHQIYPINQVIQDGRVPVVPVGVLPGHGHAYAYGHGHGSYDFSTTFHYDVHVVPECAHKNRYYYNLTFCLEDNYYPTEAVIRAIHQSGQYAEKLLSDVTYQSADNLVDGLTRAEEEDYTYQHYFGGSHQQHIHLDKFKPPYHGYTYSLEYYKKGGYICPSNIYYARPRRAMNTYGKWKVIVNLDYFPKGLGGYGHTHHKQPTFTQTLRLEQCIYSNAPCSYIDSQVHSRCLQKYNFARLLAWTYEQGLHIDTFKMPISCSCHIKQPVHYYQPVHHLVHQHHPQY